MNNWKDLLKERAKNPFIVAGVIIGIALVLAFFFAIGTVAVWAITTAFTLVAWFLAPFCTSPVQMFVVIAITVWATRNFDKLPQIVQDAIQYFDPDPDMQAAAEKERQNTHQQALEKDARDNQLVLLKAQAMRFAAFARLTVVLEDDLQALQDFKQRGVVVATGEMVIKSEDYYAGRNALEEVERMHRSLSEQSESHAAQIRDAGELTELLKSVGLNFLDVQRALPLITMAKTWWNQMVTQAQADISNGNTGING